MLAAQWLLNQQFFDGGWGYNPSVESDADSTSFVILALRNSLLEVPEIAYEHLVRYQQQDGGFSTYLPDNGFSSWTISHPDVTPVALLALLTRSGPYETAIRRGIAQVCRQQTTGGVWNSFWWNSCLYATEACLSLLHKIGASKLLYSRITNMKPTNAFEYALLISSIIKCFLSTSHTLFKSLTDRLILEQRADGSWKSEPVLRITRRDCFKPWSDPDPGPLFSDFRRLFTSATVLNALSCAYKLVSNEQFNNGQPYRL
jgi:hypothetical protein